MRRDFDMLRELLKTKISHKPSPSEAEGWKLSLSKDNFQSMKLGKIIFNKKIGENLYNHSLSKAEEMEVIIVKG